MIEKENMDILMKFLDRKVREASDEIAEKGVLSDDKAIPLMLKMQFNHIAHLEEIMDRRFAEVEGVMDRRFAEVAGVMDRRFAEVDRRFEQVDKRFAALESRMDRLGSGLALSVAFLSLLITVFKFVH